MIIGNICVISGRLKRTFLLRGQLQNQYLLYSRKDYTQWEKFIPVQRA